MLKKYNEDDFKLIYDVADDRLSPGSVAALLIVSLVFSAIMNIVAMTAVFSGDKIETIWGSLLKVCLIIWVIHLVVAIPFLWLRLAFKLQKFQSILSFLAAFKLSIEFYIIYFLLWADRTASEFMLYVGFTFLLGGVVFLILSIIRAVGLVKKGAFREDGEGLFNFSESKGYVSLPLIFAGVVIGGMIPKFFSGFVNLELIFCLFLCVLIQYAMAMALPEFILLIYCKYRFPSFHVEMPKRLNQPKRSKRSKQLR